MDAGDAPVDEQGGNLRGELKSQFKNDDIYFLDLSLNWKFREVTEARAYEQLSSPSREVSAT